MLKNPHIKASLDSQACGEHLLLLGVAHSTDTAVSVMGTERTPGPVEPDIVESGPVEPGITEPEPVETKTLTDDGISDRERTVSIWTN